MNLADVLDKGLADEHELTDLERPVFALAYFESVSDMEGWDHLFTYRMDLYPVLKLLLEEAQDAASLAVLTDYEEHFRKRGVNFTPEAIDEFLKEASADYYDACPDWRQDFADASDGRWSAVADHYLGKNIEIET